MKKLIIPLLALIGLADSIYLTIEHFDDRIVPCAPGSWSDCGRVLESEYAFLLGIPLAIWGVLHYSLLFINVLIAQRSSRWSVRQVFRHVVLAQTAIGLVMSGYFVYLQFFVIMALCQFCLVSAVVSTVLFFAARYVYWRQCRSMFFGLMAWLYRLIGKPLLFARDPEQVHVLAMHAGQVFGKIAPLRWLTAAMFYYRPRYSLSQKIAGISFPSVVGLSAGYDYEARLTQILPSVGLGFQSVGTITNQPYQGNTRPILGRLKKSKSLLVNKGFRNDGIEETMARLTGLEFPVPVGISIGVTNSAQITTLKDATADIINAFTVAERSSVRHAYYELNISCPNLHTKVSFLSGTHLRSLLKAVDGLSLTRPVFIKMPIEVDDACAHELLSVIVKHSIAGVIIGNLQKNREDQSFHSDEIKTWKDYAGNFSGRPTWHRSNELIRLVYENYRSQLIVIGCGGIFSAEDAYEKITSGASLVQLITGMIYQGPQVISQINAGLEERLEKDGYTHISEAVGSKTGSVEE